MTMKLTIRNDDSNRTAHVDTIDGETKSGPGEDLAPLESKEFWIHAGRRLDVTEVQPAEKPGG